MTSTGLPAPATSEATPMWSACGRLYTIYVMGWLVTLPMVKSMFLPMVGGRSTWITPAVDTKKTSW